jgi:hypothetical protein
MLGADGVKALGFKNLVGNSSSHSDRNFLFRTRILISKCCHIFMVVINAWLQFSTFKSA